MSGLPDRVTPVPQSLYEEIYGSSLVSCQILLVLYGVASLQCYMYYLNYPSDSPRMKAFVAWVWFLATIHAAFIAHTVWHYSVESYTNPMSLLDGEWSVYTGTTIGIVLCFTIQTFFTRMIYLMTHGVWRVALTGALTVLLMCQIAFGIYFSYSLFHLWELLRLHEAVYTAMVPLFVVRVVSDSVVSATLCVILYDSRGFSSSMRLVKTLIVYSINRFILTTFVVIAQTIILIIRPESIWAMVIEFVSAQLYFNSFMAMLNSRNRLRKISTSDSLYLSSRSRVSGSNASGRPRQNAGAMGSMSVVSAARFKRPSMSYGYNDVYGESDYREVEAGAYELDGKDVGMMVRSGDAGPGVEVELEAGAMEVTLGKRTGVGGLGADHRDLDAKHVLTS